MEEATETKGSISENEETRRVCHKPDAVVLKARI
jgi:hypothetical protein